MKFLLDQSTDARLGRYLRSEGYDTTRIGTDHPGGIKDEEVLLIAFSEKRILITEDADFAKLVFENKQNHAGVIHMHLGPWVSLSNKIDRLKQVLNNYSGNLDQFLVVSLETIELKN